PFQFVELLFGADRSLDHPAAHLGDAIKFFFPVQALFRFIALLQTGSRETLRLRQFSDLYHYRDMLLTADLDGPLVSRHQRRVIPAPNFKNLIALALFVALQSL